MILLKSAVQEVEDALESCFQLLMKNLRGFTMIEAQTERPNDDLEPILKKSFGG